MTETARAGRQFGEGPLARVAALVYTLLVTEGLFLLAVLPGVAAMFFLERDASNLPLVALCALPVGPALSAALYTLHRHRADLTDLRPAKAFWRGYRLNFRGSLAIWVPLLVWLTIIGINLAHRQASGVPVWWSWLLIVIAVAVALWGVNALIITSLFSFRVRDVARLAVHYLARTPAVTLANACLLAVATAVTLLLSEAVPALLGSLLVLGLLHGGRPMIAAVRAEFVQ